MALLGNTVTGNFLGAQTVSYKSNNCHEGALSHPGVAWQAPSKSENRGAHLRQEVQVEGEATESACWRSSSCEELHRVKRSLPQEAKPAVKVACLHM